MLKTIFTFGLGFYLGGALLMGVLGASYGGSVEQVIVAAVTWPAIVLETALFLYHGAPC